MSLTNGERIRRAHGKLAVLNVQVHDWEAELKYLTRHRRAFDKQNHPGRIDYDEACSTCGRLDG